MENNEQQVVDDVSSALLIYKNLLLTAQEITSSLTKSHLDKTTMAKVLLASLEDISYIPDRFQNTKAQKLYQAIFAINRAKNVLRNDMVDKLKSGGVEEITDEAREKMIDDNTAKMQQMEQEFQALKNTNAFLAELLKETVELTTENTGGQDVGTENVQSSQE